MKEGAIKKKKKPGALRLVRASRWAQDPFGVLWSSELGAYAVIIRKIGR